MFALALENRKPLDSGIKDAESEDIAFWMTSTTKVEAQNTNISTPRITHWRMMVARSVIVAPSATRHAAEIVVLMNRRGTVSVRRTLKATVGDIEKKQS